MGDRYIKVSAPVGIALIAAIVLIFHFWKPPDFYRGFWTEARGLVGLARDYRAYYTDCTDGRDLRPFGFFVRKFVANDDADAVAFARSAAPACRLYMLQYKPRRYFEGRWSRSYVDVDLDRH